MMHCRWLFAVCTIIFISPAHLWADVFDSYTNPVLRHVQDAPGVKEIAQLTTELMTDHDRVLANLPGTLLVVRTNEGRYSKLLTQPARQKVGDRKVPIFLIERFVTFREGQERAVQASGQNVVLFPGFVYQLDLGQVVPADLGGDLRFVVAGDKSYVEPVGKAKLYLITKPLPAAQGTKPTRLVISDKFEPSYFNGTYKLHDDGRRSGNLILKVAVDGEVTGAYYSDKDGQKYEVRGKVGVPRHSIQFTISLPRVEQQFQGWMFTGDGKAIAGVARMQERETGFYALRSEE